MKRKSVKRVAVMLVTAAIVLTGCGDSAAQSQVDSTTETVRASKTLSEGLQKYEGRKVQETSTPVFTAEDIRKIAVRKDGSDLYSIEYIPEENRDSYEYWRMRVPYEDTVLVNTEEMLKLYEMLETMQFEAVEAEKTGIENASTEIEVEFCQPSEAEESESRPVYADTTFTLLVGAEDGQGNYYTALKSEPDTTYLMDKNLIDSIVLAEPFSMILKIASVVPIETVQQVNILADGKEYVMKKNEDSYSFDGKELDQETYQKLYQELQSILLEKELPSDAEIQDDASELKLEFIRNVRNLPDVTVEYLPYNEEYDILRVNGTENFVVKKTDVDALKETISKQ